MKKILSILFAVLLMCCAAVTVSANPSPTPPPVLDYLIVDAIPVPKEAGTATPEITNPETVLVGSGELVTLTATPFEGYKFSHWKFIYGDYEIVEGTLTTSVVIIRPTGSSDIRAEAYFVKEDEPITLPPTEPVPTLPTDPVSPPTGADTSAIITVAAVASITTMAVVAVVLLKKKFSA